MADQLAVVLPILDGLELIEFRMGCLLAGASAQLREAIRLQIATPGIFSPQKTQGASARCWLVHLLNRKLPPGGEGLMRQLLAQTVEYRAAKEGELKALQSQTCRRERELLAKMSSDRIELRVGEYCRLLETAGCTAGQRREMRRKIVLLEREIEGREQRRAAGQAVLATVRAWRGKAEREAERERTERWPVRWLGRVLGLGGASATSKIGILMP